MSAIATFSSNSIQRVKRRVRRGCKRCSSASTMCIECAEEATPLVMYAKANLPMSKVKFLQANSNLMDPVVWEYDFKSCALVQEPLKMHEDIISPLCEDSETMMDNGYSLLLSGPNGTGKTTGAVRLAMSLIDSKLDVFYCTFPDLHRFNTLSYKEDMYAELMQECSVADLLIVDELGKETGVTGSVEYLADTYLKDREENFRSTIVITNLSINALRGSNHEAGRYGRSFWAMLRERFRVLATHPKAKDMRIATRGGWPGGRN